jgi:2-polyprenyl-3-methyl-5-hydroxy-6-metoxy-1,4-benzoquinol methylase
LKKTNHISATPSHYNQEAPHYDKFNEKNSEIINQTIEKILNKNKAKTILDLACGTGSQAFFLSKNGYDISAYDINAKMLDLAKAKMKKKTLSLSFSKGDMRTTQAGQFDAAITIFNAIGHLTRSDFEKTILNIRKNLHPRGLYIFDIFNLNYLLDKDNITKLTIDWQQTVANKKIREIQYSTIDQKGILCSYDIYHQQTGSRPPKVSQASQTLQIYNSSELKAMLKTHGFKTLRQCNIDGTRLSDKKSERILTVAQRN